MKNEITPSTPLRAGYEATAALMLGILGLEAIFVQLNEVMKFIWPLIVITEKYFCSKT